MLETVRQYGEAKTAGDVLRQARDAHARYYLGLAELAVPEFFSARQLEWRERLDADAENLRVAFLTMLEGPDPELPLRFGAALSHFWTSRGLYGSEIDLIERALDRMDASVPSRARGEALAAAGFLFFRRGDTASATVRLEEALRIARELGSASIAADALRTMAWVADRRGDEMEAQLLATAAVEESAASGVIHLIARAHDVRGAANQRSDPDRSQADYYDAIRYCVAAGDAMGRASVLNNLAILELERGRHERARAYFAEALAAAESVRDTALVPFLEYGAALAASLEDDDASAEPAFLKALDAARRTGQRSLVAYALLGIGLTRARNGRGEQAATLLGVSAALFDELGEKPEPTEEGLRQQALASLKVELGDTLELRLQEGGRLPVDQAVRLATAGL